MNKKFVLKSSVISLLALTGAVFISCKNTTENKLIYSENDTIKELVKNREQSITWTFEMEPDRLTKKITRSVWDIGPDVPFTPDYLKLSKNLQRPVFPSLDDFGILKTDNITYNVKDKIEDFCKKLSEYQDSEIVAFFSSKYVFNYVFFLQDFEKGWKKNFGVAIPDDEDQIIKKWLVAEPFTGTNIMQIPVRFFCNYGTIDVTIYMNPNGNNEFYQITIDRWVKV